jgi:hypothetical protein
MNHGHSLSVAALLALLPGIAAGQALPASPAEFEYAGVVDWNAPYFDSLPPLAQPRIQAQAAGRFLDALETDVMFATDGRLFLLRNPVAYESIVDLREPVGSPPTLVTMNSKSVAVLPGAADTELDAWAYADATGLRKGEFVFGGATGAAQVFTTSLSSNPSWINARFMRSANLDGVGGIDLVALTADRKTVLFRFDDGSGIVEASFTMGTTTDWSALALEDVQWTASAAREIAVLNGLGLYVFGLGGGTPLASHARVPGSNGLMTAFRNSGESVERIAWVQTNASGVSDLYEASQAGGLAVAVAGLPGTVTSVASAALTRDGASFDATDLVLTRRFEEAPIVYLNRSIDPGHQASFASVAGWYGEVDDQAPSTVDDQVDHASSLLVTDFDGDQRNDLLLMLHTVQGGPGMARPMFRYMRSEDDPRAPGGAPTILLGGRTAVPPFYEAWLPMPAQTEEARTLTMELHFDEYPAGVTHLEVTAWHQGGHLSQLESPAFSRQLFELPPNPQLETSLYPTVTLLPADDAACWNVAGDSPIYWIEARLVEASQSGGTWSIVHAYASHVAYFATLVSVLEYFWEADFSEYMHFADWGQCQQSGNTPVSAPEFCRRRRVISVGGIAPTKGPIGPPQPL